MIQLPPLPLGHSARWFRVRSHPGCHVSRNIPMFTRKISRNWWIGDHQPLQWDTIWLNNMQSYAYILYIYIYYIIIQFKLINFTLPNEPAGVDWSDYWMRKQNSSDGYVIELGSWQGHWQLCIWLADNVTLLAFLMMFVISWVMNGYPLSLLIKQKYLDSFLSALCTPQSSHQIEGLFRDIQSLTSPGLGKFVDYPAIGDRISSHLLYTHPYISSHILFIGLL